jgi:hypothetical protein
MLGIPSAMTSDNNASYALMNPYYGWYGQDTWRVTKNLTVTLGLRLEYEQAPTERYNRALTYLDPTAQLPIAAAAQAAYAASPVPELAANGFTVQGGSVYAGVNGAPRQPWQNEVMWLPRLSAAWQFSPKMIVRGGYGIYHDSINVQNVTLSQSGFSRTTSTNLTNDYGVTWLAGNPGAGTSPLADPFPVRADGTAQRRGDHGNDEVGGSLRDTRRRNCSTLNRAGVHRGAGKLPRAIPRSDPVRV